MGYDISMTWNLCHVTIISFIQNDVPAFIKKSQVEKDDNKYWLDYNTEKSDFQDNQLLHIVSWYYHKENKADLLVYDPFHKKKLM